MTNLFLINICLAAGDNNIEGWWLQILFPILIAIILAISGIFKVKSHQSKADNQRKPVQSAQSPHMRIQVNTSPIHIDREKVNVKQHHRHKPVDINKPLKNIEPKTIISLTVEPQIKEVTDLTTESIKETQALSSAYNEELIDYDQLKKSILLTEILGRPSALREFEDF